MKRLMLVLASLAVLGFVFSGCKKDKPAEPAAPADEAKKDEPPPPEPADEPKPDEEQPADEAKADEEAPADEAAAGEDKIGVPECDEYIEKYTKCIGDKVPEAARAAMEKGLQMARDGWKKAAATEAGKAALAQGCKAALDAAKKATASYNCEW
jgi:hypothetical protein